MKNEVTRRFRLMLKKMIVDSKYNSNNIMLSLGLETVKLDMLGHFYVDKIYLFGSEDDNYDFNLVKMLISFDDGDTLWYDFSKNDGKTDMFVLYASLLAKNRGTTIYQEYYDGNIKFVDLKELIIYEESSLGNSISVPWLTVLSQVMISLPYFLKCQNFTWDMSRATFMCFLDSILPISLPLALICLHLNTVDTFKENKIMKRYFSNFEQTYSNIKKNILLTFSLFALSNSLVVAALNGDKYLDIVKNLEKTMNNPFSNRDSYIDDDIWSYNKLEEAIMNNDNLDAGLKELYLLNLEEILDDYNFDLEEIYDTCATMKTREVECVIKDGKFTIAAFYSGFNNTIYDCVNAYDHDDIDMINMVKSHEIGHSFDNGTKYVWLKEGVNSLSQFEYFGYYASAYDEYMVIVRYFCELFGADVILDSFYGHSEDKLSFLLNDIYPSIDAEQFLLALDGFEIGAAESDELVEIMRLISDSANLSDDSRECIDSYLDYLSLKSNSYQNRGYISSKYINDVKEGSRLIKRR